MDKRFKLPIFMCMFLVMFILLASAVDFSSYTKLEYVDGRTDDSNYNLDSAYWMATTFTIGNLGTNTTSVVYGISWFTGNCTTTLLEEPTYTLAIRETDASFKPTGNDLCNFSVRGHNLTIGEGSALLINQNISWYNFTISGCPSLSAGGTYAVVFKSNGTVPCSVTPRNTQVGSYYGLSWNSVSPFTSWSGGTGNDTYPIEIWGLTAGTSTTLNSPPDLSNQTNPNVTFSCSGTSNTDTMVNLSIYSNRTGTFTLEQTQDVSGLGNTTVRLNNFTATSFHTDTFLWNCFTCDNLGCSFATSNYSFVRDDYFVDRETYNTTTYEFSTESFEINITYNNSFYTTSTAQLIYNNTAYSTSKYGSGGKIQFRGNVPVPSVTASTNKSFYFKIGLTNSTGISYFNSTMYNQTIYNIAIDDCSAYTTPIFNFTLRDEESQAIIEGSTGTEIEITAIISSRINPDIQEVYNNTFTNVSSANICLSNSTSGQRVDIEARYEATDYVEEYYFLENYTLTTSPQNKSFYDLLLVDSTSFVVGFLNSNNVLVEDVLVSVMRKYIGENTFKEVEVGRTNDNGETILHLVEEDVYYIFNVTQEGRVLYTSVETPVYCSSTTDVCRIELQQGVSSTPIPSDWDRISTGKYSITANQTTRTITLTFELTESATMNLTVFKYSNNQSEMNTPVGSNQITTDSGSISIVVPHSYGNATYLATIYKDGNWVADYLVPLKESGKDIFGQGLGVFMSALIVLTLGLMAVSTGVGLIVFALLGFMLVIFLNLLDMPYSNLYLYMYPIVAGVLLIIRIMMRRSRG